MNPVGQGGMVGAKNKTPSGHSFIHSFTYLCNKHLCVPT